MCDVKNNDCKHCKFLYNDEYCLLCEEYIEDNACYKEMIKCWQYSD